MQILDWKPVKLRRIKITNNNLERGNEGEPKHMNIWGYGEKVKIVHPADMCHQCGIGVESSDKCVQKYQQQRNSVIFQFGAFEDI